MRSAPLLFAATTVALSFSVLTARADRAAADRCAAQLPANAKLIYASVIGDVKPDANVKDIVRSKTRSLVISGKLRRGEARGAAEAAGTCLKQAM
jgi:hypothetical protein